MTIKAEERTVQANGPGGLATKRDGSLPRELTPEEIAIIDSLVIDDGVPVDSLFVERQSSLLVEPLHTSWEGPGAGRPFLVMANVGLFYDLGEPPLVPDVMLSLDVVLGDRSEKKDRSYFVRVLGKLPEVAIEIVSDKRGGEETHKMREYARIGVKYYVIFDPEDHLTGGLLRVFGLERSTYVAIPAGWLPDVGLGLKFWQGSYQGWEDDQWIRWCDQRGSIYLTGQERAEQERQRTEQERQRAEQERQRALRLEAQLRALGQEPASE